MHNGIDISWQPHGQKPKIAILRALNLGDLLLAVPALRAIRKQFPQAEITFIGLPWAQSFAQRFSCYIDRFVEFAGYPGIAEVEVVPERIHRFLNEQRGYSYDLVVQMHGNGQTSNPCALALGGRITVGYNLESPDSRAAYRRGESAWINALRSPWGGAGLPRGKIVSAPYPQNAPEVMRNLGLAKLLGCCNLDPQLEFPCFTSDMHEAQKLLHLLPSSARPWIALHTGARPPVRRWPPEYFAAVADTLAQRFGAQIILTGAQAEQATVQAVAERMHSQPLNVVGRTSLGGLAALIREIDLCISNDTGPAHLATAVGTASITIFGPVDVHRWAALDTVRHPAIHHSVACSPCTYWECPIDHRCLRWVTPSIVLAQAEKLLTKGAIACSA